jgi:hypothetical protein
MVLPVFLGTATLRTKLPPKVRKAGAGCGFADRRCSAQVVWQDYLAIQPRFFPIRHGRLRVPSFQARYDYLLGNRMRVACGSGAAVRFTAQNVSL